MRMNAKDAANAGMRNPLAHFRTYELAPKTVAPTVRSVTRRLSQSALHRVVAPGTEPYASTPLKTRRVSAKPPTADEALISASALEGLPMELANDATTTAEINPEPSQLKLPMAPSIVALTRISFSARASLTVLPAVASVCSLIDPAWQ